MFEGVSVFALVVVAFSVVTALMGVQQAPRRTVPSVPDDERPLTAQRPSVLPKTIERGGDVAAFLLTYGHLAALAWLVGGAVLCAAEALAPGAFFVWIGAAAVDGAIQPRNGSWPI